MIMFGIGWIPLSQTPPMWPQWACVHLFFHPWSFLSWYGRKTGIFSGGWVEMFLCRVTTLIYLCTGDGGVLKTGKKEIKVNFSSLTWKILAVFGVLIVFSVSFDARFAIEFTSLADHKYSKLTQCKRPDRGWKLNLNTLMLLRVRAQKSLTLVNPDHL